MKTGLVSFTLFGEDPDDIYYGGAYKNAQLYGEYHPEWQLRFYLGDSVPDRVERQLYRYGAEVIRQKDEPEDQTATGWRFLALRQPGWDFYLFRDCDSRPIARERAAVAQWLASDRDFHSMRDHLYHNVPMLAGLWGCKAGGAELIRGLVPDRLEGDYYQVDQRWLSKVVWRKARRSVMVHTYAVRFPFDRGRSQFPFPTPREGLEFVGEGLYADDSPRQPTHRELIRSV